MKKTVRKPIPKKRRTLENLADMVSSIDYNKIAKQQKQFLHNLMVTNENLLKSNNVNNLLLF